MISGQSIICFAANSWDDIWRNRHQIMTRLATHNRILFVEPPQALRQIAPQLRRGNLRVLQPTQLYSPINNLWVYKAPTYAPASGRKPISDITFALRLRSLKGVMKKLGMRDPILWIFQYDLGEMIGHLDESLTIYHAVDEYSAYRADYTDINGQSWQQTVKEREAQLIKRVDLVFVTSPALYESKQHLHPHMHLVKNGVDYDLFSKPSPNGLWPPDIAAIPTPRICYSGNINDKLDLELLNAVVAKHPEWQFVFVGPDSMAHKRDRLTQLKSLPNTHFLGRKPVEQLPIYMRACEVCLIPYERNEWTRNVSPLKLYEYLATGLPIVSTDIAAAREFRDVLWLANDPESFSVAIATAMAASSQDRNHKQQLIARDHTWDNRVSAISALVQARLVEKTPASAPNAMLHHDHIQSGI